MPSNVNESARARNSIYTLPGSALKRLASDGDERAHVQAMVADHAIDLQVDWDGNASSLGRFEVRADGGAWKACELIDPSDTGIDVISLSQIPAGNVYLARFRRGPQHSSHTFGVKAVPIVWKQPLPAQLDPSYVAVRDQDYEYEAGIQPTIVPWVYSVLTGGVQRLTLELSLTRDYEMWVCLQDPNVATNWQIQDPIIRRPVPTLARR